MNRRAPAPTPSGRAPRDPASNAPTNPGASPVVPVSPFLKEAYVAAPLSKRAPVTLLVIGDPHGYWRYLSAVIRGFRDAAGYWPDAIIDVGDRGYYPTPESMDKATRKHSAREPEQVEGLRRLLSAGGDPVIEALLEGAPPIDGIGGNHEAHQALSEWVKQHAHGTHIPLDPKGRLRMLRNGTVSTYSGPSGISVRVGALWGIEPASARTTQRALGKHIDPAAVAKLRSARFDILISHDGPRSDQILPGQTVGSPDVATLLSQSSHTLGFFGHYHHREGRDLALPNSSRAIQLGISRKDVDTAFVVVRGVHGDWSVDPWTSVPAWHAAAMAHVHSLPKGAVGADTSEESPESEPTDFSE